MAWLLGLVWVRFNWVGKGWFGLSWCGYQVLQDFKNKSQQSEKNQRNAEKSAREPILPRKTFYRESRHRSFIEKRKRLSRNRLSGNFGNRVSQVSRDDINCFLMDDALLQICSSRYETQRHRKRNGQGTTQSEAKRSEATR